MAQHAYEELSDTRKIYWDFKRKHFDVITWIQIGVRRPRHSETRSLLLFDVWMYIHKNTPYFDGSFFQDFFELYELDADLGEQLFGMKMTYRLNMRSVGVNRNHIDK